MVPKELRRRGWPSLVNANGVSENGVEVEHQEEREAGRLGGPGPGGDVYSLNTKPNPRQDNEAPSYGSHYQLHYEAS